MQPSSEIRSRWVAQLLVTAPADRASAEKAVRALYTGAGFSLPPHCCWFESPFDAAWAVALLIEARNSIWRDLVGAARKRRDERQRIDRVVTALCERCSVSSLEQARAVMGPALTMSLSYPAGASGLHPAIFSARMGLRGGDVAALFGAPADDDELYRAESRFWGGNHGVLISELLCPTVARLTGQSFLADYSFWTMAVDESLAVGRDVPAVLEAAWTAARNMGLWWPFANGAVLTERPAEIHVNAHALLHREDGPALVYRDGVRAFAWNGMAVPEAWIMAPETLPAATFRGFDPTFRAWADRRRRQAPKPARPSPSAAIVDVELPADADERVRLLRAHAGGALPMFDRYTAGDREAVWAELLDRGEDVRHDPYAADALAVAYETMRRVDVNVRTLAQRLTAIGYRFGPSAGESGRLTSLLRRGRQDHSQAHVAPGPRARSLRLRVEKRVGPLPLSLRAFYEVVGTVNLMGRHPRLAPANGTVAEDPLVVYGVTDAWEQVAGMEDEEIEEIVLAPDDLHKAGTSGGDPYAMAVPDRRADGELLHERHGLLFVPYLRLCFEWGGFPGYEGQTDAPSVIADLAAGLLLF